MKNRIGLILFNILISFSTFFAQVGGSTGISSARSVGMANTYTSITRGVYSIGYNPANLMFSEDNHFEFATVLPLPNVNMRTGTDFLTIEDYNYFFGGVKDQNGNIVSRHLTNDDKDRLKSIFEGGGFLITDVSTSYLSASLKINDNIGAIGIGVNDIITGKMNFPEQFISLVLDGNTVGKIYNFNDGEIKGWWLRNYSFTYARDFGEIPQNIFEKISAGITFKYVQGFSYVGTEYIKSTFETGSSNELISNGNLLAYSAFSPDFNVKYDFDSTQSSEEGNFTPFPSPAGTGLGFDFGIAAQLNEVWSFGMAVTDIGKVRWDKGAVEFSTSNKPFYLTDITTEGIFDSLADSFTGEGKYINEFSTPLPTAFRFGMSFQADKFFASIPGTLLLAFDYNQGFNNQPRNSTNPRFSLGAEWKPMDWIPFIRTGLSVGGRDAFGWAFGIGIDTGMLEFNFGSPDFHYLFMANNAKRIAAAISTRWKF